MKISLIITTYNWPKALGRVLDSVSKQTELPHEVIIADDGSTDETRLLIEEWQKKLPVPLIHSWQKDDGFRAARSRNLAISKASSDYIVMIDGDMVLHQGFLLSHYKFAEDGFFVQGSRVILDKEESKKVLRNKKISFFSKGIKNRFNAIHLPLLTPLYRSQSFSMRGIKTCNIAFWKTDLEKVNGFNNKFIGWGREDSELVCRLYNLGIKRKNLKLGGCAFHLYHPENERTMLPENDLLLQEASELKLIECKDGLKEVSIF